MSSAELQSGALEVPDSQKDNMIGIGGHALKESIMDKKEKSIVGAVRPNGPDSRTSSERSRRPVWTSLTCYSERCCDEQTALFK